MHGVVIRVDGTALLRRRTVMRQLARSVVNRVFVNPVENPQITIGSATRAGLRQRRDALRDAHLHAPSLLSLISVFTPILLWCCLR